MWKMRSWLRPSLQILERLHREIKLHRISATLSNLYIVQFSTHRTRFPPGVLSSHVGILDINWRPNWVGFGPTSFSYLLESLPRTDNYRILDARKEGKYFYRWDRVNKKRKQPSLSMSFMIYLLRQTSKAFNMFRRDDKIFFSKHLREQ